MSDHTFDLTLFGAGLIFIGNPSFGELREKVQHSCPFGRWVAECAPSVFIK